MKYYGVLFVLFLFSSCDVSTLSNADASDLAKLKVNILIQDGNKSDALDYIKVKLTDGKKQIINENISILINDLPLDLYVKDDLYYTKTSFYKTDSLARKEAYYFEIILPISCYFVNLRLLLADSEHIIHSTIFLLFHIFELFYEFFVWSHFNVFCWWTLIFH